MTWKSKKPLLKKFTICIALLCATASGRVVYAQSCEDFFKGGVQINKANGEINFGYAAQLLNNPGNVLTTPALSQHTYYNPFFQPLSCQSQRCEANGQHTPSRQLDFAPITSNQNLVVRFAERATLGANFQHNYKDVILRSATTLDVLEQTDGYRIRKLVAGYSSTINLAPGDYWLDQLVLNSQVTINVIGEGTARIFVKDRVQIGYASKINYQPDQSQPQKLFLYANKNIQFNSSVKAVGTFYSNGQINIPYRASIEGALNALNIRFSALGEVIFNADALNRTDFGEFCGSSPIIDLDGDGIPDDQDSDRDGDGVDNDNDVFPDDPSESSDIDGDGIGDNADTDRDGDGVDNDSDAFPNDPSETTDLDADGIGDNADTDRDGDGFANDLEASYNTDPNDKDSFPADIDGDKIPDDVDPDRDGDGVDNADDLFPNDPTESGDIDGDGVGDNADLDRDGDGISNENEEAVGTDPSDPNDTPSDLDGDAIPDQIDNDIDGDGVPNTTDAFPLDPTESSDIDGDGVGDNTDLDRDGDGVSNAYEEQLGTDPNNPADVPADLDSDGIPDAFDNDIDGDGVANDVDAFPNDPNESSDIDGDGIGDNADLDRDGDGISNAYEEQLGTDPNNPADKPADLDSDGIPDALDDDKDGDGVNNDDDAFPEDAAESADLDGDGIGDNADTDRDGDGISNEFEEQLGTDPNNPADKPADLDSDGIPDALDDDIDGDGVNNDDDAFPEDATETADLDNDGIGDNADTDRDGDGISNEFEEQLGTDPNNPADKPADLDGDGIPDALDDDIDGDGVTNDNDVFPLDPTETSDLDGDGIGDNADTDRDGDGISNEFEEQLGTDPNNPADKPADLDGDGIPDALDNDIDGDGVNNDDDAFPLDPTETSDLDGDGIGDNADTDRDGDGVDNDDEADNNTDPDDSSDFPDTVAPDVAINNPTSSRTANAQVNVTGAATDATQPYSGVADVYATSGSINYRGSFDPDTGAYNIEVPLTLGSNQIIVVATDVSGNQSQEQISVERISTPTIVSVTPANGTVVVQDTVTITGSVSTILAADEFILTINESRVSTTSTAQGNVYSFSFENVSLSLGENVFRFSLSSDYAGDQKTITINHQPEDSELLPVPTFSDSEPADGSSVNRDSFRVGLQIESSAGPLTVNFNGEEILSADEGQLFYPLSELVTFVDSENEVTVSIEASDSLGRTAQQELTFYRDDSAPTIVIDQGFSPTPAINPVDSSPVSISGRISDSNLTAVLINNNPVSLQPGADENTYRFDVNIPITSADPVPVTIQAFDRSGNAASVEYVLQNDSPTSISGVLPPDGAEFVGKDIPLNVQVVARLAGLTGNEKVEAYVQGSSQRVELTVTGTLASGDLSVSQDSGEKTIVYELQSASGQRISSDRIKVEVVNANDIPIDVIRVEPANNAKFIEPNAAIEVYFNRAIDPSKLTIKVSETLHGKSYVNADELGEDFINAKGFVLTDVNKDFEPVIGQVDPIPGDVGASFSASNLLGYNADVFVEVLYDGQQLSRSTFKVRELPTFINGAVVDQFGQPLKGISVELPELERKTTTNGDGGFAFGYQETGDQLIASGSYQILINDEFANPRFGTANTQINVQQNRRNDLARVTLQELDRSISFYNVNSGRSNQLAGGDLSIDLSEARVLFINGRTSGPMHAQFLPFEHIGVNTYPGARPQWLFGLQPKGIKVEGSTELEIKIPKLRGNYDYIDFDVYKYVVLLGYNATGEVVEPIGVGKIENLMVKSVGKVVLTSLDYIGYAVALPTMNDDLARYGNGEISLQQLKALLQAQSSVQP